MLTVIGSLCTAAVKPAALLPFPEVYTEMGEAYAHASIPIHSNRPTTDLLDKLQQLRLGSTGVTEQQHIDIPSKVHAIRKNSLRPSEQQTSNRFFDIYELAQ